LWLGVPRLLLPSELRTLALFLPLVMFVLVLTTATFGGDRVEGLFDLIT